MKKLKHLILLSVSLLLLFSSFATSKPASSVTSFQSKSVECNLSSIIPDDLDDDYIDGHSISPQVISYLIPSVENNFKKLNYFQHIVTALPGFLRVRSLRI